MWIRYYWYGGRNARGGRTEHHCTSFFLHFYPLFTLRYPMGSRVPPHCAVPVLNIILFFLSLLGARFAAFFFLPLSYVLLNVMDRDLLTFSCSIYSTYQHHSSVLDAWLPLPPFTLRLFAPILRISPSVDFKDCVLHDCGDASLAYRFCHCGLDEWFNTYLV